MAPALPATTSATEALLGALADRPGATAAELAEAAGIGRSTAGKLLASLAVSGQVVRQPGGRQDRRRPADHWTLPAPLAEAIAHPTAVSATAPADTADEGRQQRPESGRLRAGELRRLVLACLAGRPSQALSPTAIAKELGRSAGAVSNALRVLADQGAVVQLQAKPRRYAIAEAGTQDTPT